MQNMHLNTTIEFLFDKFNDFSNNYNTEFLLIRNSVSYLFHCRNHSILHQFFKEIYFARTTKKALPFKIL